MSVASPCTDVCTIDAASGYCAGCLRSVDEIAAWGALDEAGKRAVWKLLPARRAALRPAEPGHPERSEGSRSPP